MEKVLDILQTLTIDELNRIKTEATSQIHILSNPKKNSSNRRNITGFQRIKNYFKNIEDDDVLTPELIKLVTDGVITVVQVTENEPPKWWDARSEKGIYMNIKLRIKGIQDLVELRYITHSSENTFTEHIGIKLDGKLYEYGIGNHKHEYYSDCGCVFSRCLRNCHAEEIYVLRKLHTILNIDYDQTAAMIHLLFGCWSNYNSNCGHPDILSNQKRDFTKGQILTGFCKSSLGFQRIKDSIQSLEKLIELWE